MSGEEEFGVVEGLSLPGYEIESAISSTAEATKGTDGLTNLILNNHLEELCEMQLKYLTSCVEEQHG